MMDWLRAYAPDEILSAWSSGRRATKTLGQTSHPVIKLLISTLVPAAAGLLLGLFTFDYHARMFNDATVAWIIRVGLSVSGFAIALMMFTGYKPDHTMEPDDAEDFRDKVLYMHFCQILTFLAAAATVVTGLVWILAATAGWQRSREIMVFLLLAFLCLSISRVALLPFQIFELHAYGVESRVDASRQRVSKQIEEEQEVMRKSLDKPPMAVT